MPAHLRGRVLHGAGPGRATRARPATPDDFTAYQVHPSARRRGARLRGLLVAAAAGGRVNPEDGSGTGQGDRSTPRAVLRVPGHPSGPAPRGLTIPLSELTWRFSGASGPGGQHVNTTNSRAEVVFDLAGSPSVPEAARTLLLQRLGPVVAVAAGDRRSQSQNRELALTRLTDRLAGALEVRRNRRPTRPTRGSERRRLEAKHRQAQRKRDRGGRWEGE